MAFRWRTICATNADFAARNDRFFYRMWDLGGIAFDRTRVVEILKKMRCNS